MLKNGLYIAEGTAGGYKWLITGAMPGVIISDRWLTDTEGRFDTKAKCMNDLDDAVAAIKTVQQKLASGAGFVHADSHTGNVGSSCLHKIKPRLTLCVCFSGLFLPGVGLHLLSQLILEALRQQ